ncbi:1-acyl-sn-glycerol-3-phosphate acyltransferase [Litorimonas cladophorae]|nr:1-acyl-sn-glycerol-3-phosphate acyltransferase [Litorimonas cladophorae]
MTLPLPPNAPAFGNKLSRAFGRLMLRSVGMKLGGTVPDVPKVILLGTPHTSNWDLILAMGMRFALGLEYKWMMKKEAFFFPMAGTFKAMGGIPIDRKAAKDVVGQIADWFDANEKAWIGITPAGTRTKVESYKKGYLRIAYATGVPIFVVGVNSETKTLVFDQFIDLTGDIDVDNARVRDFVRSHYTGLKPENS